MKRNYFSDKLATTKIPDFGIILTTYYAGDKVAYKMYVGGKLLFKGIDFKPSPLNNWDDLESSISLLGFLSVGIHDTDQEYFKDYTPAQMAWAKGNDIRELLSGLISDASDKTSDYYEGALKEFKHKKA